MKKRSILFMVVLVLGASLLFAHTPLLSCFDNGDDTITCEGGFSNGASAQGVKIKVIDQAGKPIKIKDENGKMVEFGILDKAGNFTFEWPVDAKGKKIKDFIIVFDAGPGHVVKVKSKDIE